MFMDHKCPYYKYVNFDIQRDSMKSQSKPQQVVVVVFFGSYQIYMEMQRAWNSKASLEKSVSWKTHYHVSKLIIKLQ